MNKADVARVAVRMSKQSVGGQVSSSLSCQATPGVCGQHWASPVIRGSESRTCAGVMRVERRFEGIQNTSLRNS